MISLTKYCHLWAASLEAFEMNAHLNSLTQDEAAWECIFFLEA